MPSLIRGVSRCHQSGDGIEAIEVANHFYLTFWSPGNREVVFYLIAYYVKSVYHLDASESR